MHALYQLSPFPTITQPKPSHPQLPFLLCPFFFYCSPLNITLTGKTQRPCHQLARSLVASLLLLLLLLLLSLPTPHTPHAIHNE
ncbi:MAG: hypothetical protein J3R72DRAFT_437045 [Linnemannia gamsii]|nr:MAG: hypothetical protein J3R72DRAFT_437045 [Linnemannia gamsii]